jgi:ligand-binding SRPBCC domain-containing protein
MAGCRAACHQPAAICGSSCRPVGYRDRVPRTFRLRTSQLVARDLQTTFAFFADAANLQRLTPPLLDFVIATPLPIAMQQGTLIDYRLTLRGIPMRWRTLISVWEPPHRFVDEQLRGPYRYWRHEHRFTAMPEGTLVEDEVRYRVLGGALVNPLVKRDLMAIFTFRQRELLRALDVPAGPASIAFDSI